MSAKYQIVHFLPDPFSGARLPIAALVEVDGRPLVAEAIALPSARCLGSEALASALRMVRDLLHDAPAFGRLPLAVGPQACLGDVQTVPAEVSEPVVWLREHVLPRRAELADTLSDADAEGPRRTSWGRRFCETQGVGQFVKSQFRPSQWKQHQVPSVSQFVQGRGRVLLLEPLVGARRRFEEDAAEVNRSFLALQRAAQIRQPAEQWSYVVYYQPSSMPERNAEVRSMLEAANDVIDVSQPRERNALLGQVREVGLSGLDGDVEH